MKPSSAWSLPIFLGILLLLVAFWAYRFRAALFFHPEMPMILASSAFTTGGSIPTVYTCEGKNINPPLRIRAVPRASKSLALIMEDPDVPKNLRPDGMWDHWVMWNIDPLASEIPENSAPLGVMGKNSWGALAYAGPCPPDREHRYFFKLFALDAMLDLPVGSSKKELLEALFWHILEQTELMGRYVKRGVPRK